MNSKPSCLLVDGDLSVKQRVKLLFALTTSQIISQLIFEYSIKHFVELAKKARLSFPLKLLISI